MLGVVKNHDFCCFIVDFLKGNGLLQLFVNLLFFFNLIKLDKNVNN